MKFSTREDIEAPIDAVFNMLCDFESFERAAMRRGADVQRLDNREEPGVGAMWEASFTMRGKRREIELELVEFDRPNDMAFESKSPGVLGRTGFELIALSRGRTRVMVSLELKPLNLSARLLVQSLKLAKGKLSQRFSARVAEYARGMEERYADESGTSNVGQGLS